MSETTNYIYWRGQKVDDMDREHLIKCCYYMASALKVKEAKLFQEYLFLSTLIYFIKCFVVLTGVVLFCMIVAYFLKLYGVIL